MNDSRWGELTKIVEAKFDIEDDYQEEIPTQDGGGISDVLIFNGPVGKIKLVRLIKPLVLGKKTFYSKRGQGETAVQYEYSEDETTQSMKIYKWDEFNDEWQEVNSNNMSNILG